MYLMAGAGLLLVVAVLTIACRQDPSPSDDANTTLLKQLSTASRDLSRSVGAAVVRIEVERDPALVNDELKRMFGGTIPSASQGSGVVVSEDGHVLTNYHVVANSDRIIVLSDSDSYSAQVVGFDVLTDLALLKVENLEQPAIQWGNSDEVAVGEFAWAIGNPLGLQRSVTFGIISAVEQETVSDSIFQNFFQTDAALNPGSSGGPLVNVQAEVIGINTAIVGNGFQGISFAIPSNTAREVVEELLASWPSQARLDRRAARRSGRRATHQWSEPRSKGWRTHRKCGGADTGQVGGNPAWRFDRSLGCNADHDVGSTCTTGRTNECRTSHPRRFNAKRSP